MTKKVLSGIRATGRLHLGNYLGAVKGMLELQNNPEYETFYMVADVHSITTPYNIDELRRNRREVVIDYLAAGLDPKKSVIFQQADVTEHIELAFYFSSVVTIAKMQHLPTFKEKVKQYPENATMALLNYPILMAADILVYKAGLVPVGIDQEPHLEVAREIARRMNQDYGTDFPEPQRFATKGEYVPSLTGDGKMSKTVEGSYINLTDDLETIKSKVARIPTDGGRGKVDRQAGTERVAYVSETGQDVSGVASLLTLVGLFLGAGRREELEKQYTGGGIRYGEVKAELADAIYNDLKPIQDKRKELENNPGYVDEVINEGAEKARFVAGKTVKEVREKMGLG
jgi:tryptophanyl-tRNA synthetase